MKTITIIIEPVEGETTKSHHLECMAAVNGRYYHDCLKSVCDILIGYEKKNKNKPLPPEAKKLLDDIKKKAAIYFRGIYHEK